MYNEGLERMLVELISNIQDNATRTNHQPYTDSCKASFMKLDINQETGWITISNDGNPLAAERLEFTYPREGTSETITKKLYPITHYFGQMYTSTNYDADQRQTTSGLYGIGAKVVNILSEHFEISSGDPKLHKTVSQSFEDHMKPELTSKPRLTKFFG